MNIYEQYEGTPNMSSSSLDPDGWMTHVLAICPGSQLGISDVERADWRSLKTCRGCLEGSWSSINTHDDSASDGKGLQQWHTVKHFACLGVPVSKLFNIQLRKFLSISDRRHMLIWYDMIWYDIIWNDIEIISSHPWSANLDAKLRKETRSSLRKLLVKLSLSSSYSNLSLKVLLLAFRWIE